MKQTNQNNDKQNKNKNTWRSTYYNKVPNTTVNTIFFQGNYSYYIYYWLISTMTALLCVPGEGRGELVGLYNYYFVTCHLVCRLVLFLFLSNAQCAIQWVYSTVRHNTAYFLHHLHSEVSHFYGQKSCLVLTMLLSFHAYFLFTDSTSLERSLELFSGQTPQLSN